MEFKKIKKVLIVFIFFLVNCAGCRKNITESPDYPAAFPSVTFKKTFGGSDRDVGLSVIQNRDGDYMMLGWSKSYGDGSWDMYLVKGITDGNAIYESWRRTYGGSGEDCGRSIRQTADGGYMLFGFTDSTGAGDKDFYLVKVDSGGNREWEKTYGGSGQDEGRDARQTTDGGYVMTGFTKSFGEGMSDMYLVKADKEGNVEWERTFGGDGLEYGSSVEQAPDGGYIVLGLTKSSGSNMMYLIKTDQEGKEEWGRAFGGDSKGRSVICTADGGYALLGDTCNTMYFVKTDSKGYITQSRTFRGNGIANGYSLRQTTDGGYILLGDTRSVSFGRRGSNDIYLVKVMPDGDELHETWSRTFGGDGSDIGWSVWQDRDGGYIALGWTDSFTDPNGDMWIIKTDTDGNVAK